FLSLFITALAQKNVCVILIPMHTPRRNSMNLRRTLLSSVAAAAALAAFAPAALAADNYPSRPLKLIVPFGAGGSTDIVARLLADKMGPILGQSVVIENKGGAG